MNIFGFYVEKKTIFIIVVIILAITLGIISVNVRINKNKISKNTFQGYEADEGEEPQFYGDGDFIGEEVALYDYANLIPYFSEFRGAMEFEEYLNNYIVNSGTTTTEWWITNISYDEKTSELSFAVRTNDKKEYFYVQKNNTDTFINYVHE